MVATVVGIGIWTHQPFKLVIGNQFTPMNSAFTRQGPLVQHFEEAALEAKRWIRQRQLTRQEGGQLLTHVVCRKAS